MLTEMNKGFYGLRPLNQAAVQAVGISISLKLRLRFRLNPQLQLLGAGLSRWALLLPEKGKRNVKMPQIRCKLSPKETKL